MENNMARKRTPRTKKTVTLAEFTAWLEGVEELQEKDWVPTAPQWKLIRTKIKSIVSDDPVIQQVVQHVPTFNQPQNTNQPSQQPSNLPAGIPPMPLPPSSIPMGSVELGDNAKNMGMQVKTGQNGEKVLKTPDIDGEYSTSTFG
jgi:hypothetical protein